MDLDQSKFKGYETISIIMQIARPKVSGVSEADVKAGKGSLEG
jgi:hypothetical protein